MLGKKIPISLLKNQSDKNILDIRAQVVCNEPLAFNNENTTAWKVGICWDITLEVTKLVFWLLHHNVLFLGILVCLLPKW
jgi:hypothetical protein